MQKVFSILGGGVRDSSRLWQTNTSARRFADFSRTRIVEAKVKTTTVQEDGTQEDTLMQDLAPAEANAAPGDRHARLSLWSVAHFAWRYH